VWTHTKTTPCRPRRGVQVKLSFVKLGVICGWVVNATSRPLYPREIDPAVFTVNRTCPICRPNTFCGTNKKGEIHLNITGLVRFGLHCVLSCVFGACRHCDLYCSVGSLEHQLSGFHSRSAPGPTHPPFDGYRCFFPGGVKLNLCLAPRLIVSGAIPPPSLYAFLAWTVTALPFRVV